MSFESNGTKPRFFDREQANFDEIAGELNTIIDRYRSLASAYKSLIFWFAAVLLLAVIEAIAACFLLILC